MKGASKVFLSLWLIRFVSLLTYQHVLMCGNGANRSSLHLNCIHKRLRNDYRAVIVIFNWVKRRIHKLGIALARVTRERRSECITMCTNSRVWVIGHVRLMFCLLLAVLYSVSLFCVVFDPSGASTVPVSLLLHVVFSMAKMSDHSVIEKHRVIVQGKKLVQSLSLVLMCSVFFLTDYDSSFSLLYGQNTYEGSVVAHSTSLVLMLKSANWQLLCHHSILLLCITRLPEYALKR